MTRLVVAALALAVAVPLHAAPRAFSVQDLATLDRISEASLSPDGRSVVLHCARPTTRRTRARTACGPAGRRRQGRAPAGWRDHAALVERRWVDLVPRRTGRCPAALAHACAGRRGRGGQRAAADIGSYKLAGRPPCRLQRRDLRRLRRRSLRVACTKQRLDKPADAKASGQLYDRLFVRHWDSWADGRRSQLFVAALGDDGKLGEPVLVSKGLDGDVPSKPFGDDSEYAFSPDGGKIYFGVRTAGASEAWSTNFDLHVAAIDGSAPAQNLTAGNPAWDAYPLPSADGSTLYYLAMQRPGFEADRFAIRALDLASGEHRASRRMDRSAGALKLSADVHIHHRRRRRAPAVRRRHRQRQGHGWSATARRRLRHRKSVLVARNDLKTPNACSPTCAAASRSRASTPNYRDLRTGEHGFFTFKGANGATVQEPWFCRLPRRQAVSGRLHHPRRSAGRDEQWLELPLESAAPPARALPSSHQLPRLDGYGHAFTDSISQDWGGKPLEDLKLGWGRRAQEVPVPRRRPCLCARCVYGG